MKKQIKMRRCVSCRQIKEKSEFLRMVKLADGRIFVDEKGKAQGRGAYVCIDEKCAADVKKKRRLDKQFKTKIDAETYDAIYNSVCKKIELADKPDINQSSERE